MSKYTIILIEKSAYKPIILSFSRNDHSWHFENVIVSGMKPTSSFDYIKVSLFTGYTSTGNTEKTAKRGDMNSQRVLRLKSS